MLLRSASTPILNSFIPHTVKDSSPEPECVYQFRRTRPTTLTASSSGSLSRVDHDYSARKMTRPLSESNLRDLAVFKKKQPPMRVLDRTAVEEDDEEEEEEEERDLGGVELGEGGGFNIGSFAGIFLGSGLDSRCEVGGGFGGGGRICGVGGGSNGGDSGDGGFGDEWENGRKSESPDAYYQRMIEADPGNPLLLSNYAKYLKELRGDLVKAEEYCGRAILVNRDDGDALSMYGDLIWQQYKDAGRAEAYFDQAVKASPDDCFVMASYARFLWDAEEDDEELPEEPVGTSPPSFFHEIPPSVSPIAAAS